MWVHGRTVAYITDSQTFGGAEQVLLSLITELDRARWHPVLIYLPTPGLVPLLDGARRLNVQVCPIPSRHGPSLVSRADRFARLVGLLRHLRPTVLHANLAWPLAGKFGLAAAYAARVPVILATVHSCDVVPNKPAMLLHALIGQTVDAYVAVSATVARRLGCRLRVPGRKLHVIRNGVPLEQFAPAPQRPRRPESGDRPVVLALSRLEPQKGIRFLLSAATRLPEADFVVAGDGPERLELERLARTSGLTDRFRFIGYQPDTRRLLAECDVLTLPSLDEGLPLAILEAMAARKPVVATNVGGIPEAIVNSEHGLLVPPSDPLALARALRSVLSDPVLAQRLATAGHARVQREFSSAAMAGQVMQLYDELTSAPPRGRGRG